MAQQRYVGTSWELMTATADLLVEMIFSIVIYKIDIFISLIKAPLKF